MRIVASLFLLSVFSFSCQKEIKEKIGFKNEVLEQENQKLAAKISKQTVEAWLNGYVIDEQQQPVSGAIVECGGKTTQTNSKGYFYFKDKLSVNRDYTLVKVSKQGYMNGFRTFTPNQQKLSFHTVKLELQSTGNGQIVASSGGTITLDNLKLTFPSGSFVKPDGSLYTGNVKVLARYINPDARNFPNVLPGILSGLNNSGQINALQSLGMANVEMSDASGNRLEIASGKTVKLEFPASASGPSSVALWHFNETYGIWIQQGTATKQGSTYIAEVNHFSIWNLDLEYNSFRLDLSFVDNNQNPLSTLQVFIYRQSNNAFVGNYFTDNNGQATLINCPSNDGLVLKSVLQCDTLTKIIAPVTQSRSETVIFSSSGANVRIYNFNGTLFDCNNSPLLNQPFQILLGTANYGGSILGITDAQGRYATGTIICNTSNSAQVQTAAYYNSAFRYSSVSTFPAGTNIYNPVVCDTLIPGSGFQDNEIVIFTDPKLELRVREAINKPTGTIFYIDVKFLSALTANSDTIQTLGGIQYCTSLSILKLNSNRISDITLLGTLPSLTELELYGNNITNISPLQSLINLQKLNIGGNPLASFTPLQNMTSLTFLALNSTGLTNLSVLQNLTNLKTLFAGTNQINNLSPLQNLTQLTSLNIWENQISDITPLQNLTNLTRLEIWTNRISNIAPLQNLTSLTMLELGRNQITNITPLQNLTGLTNLGIDYNQLTNITSLQNLTGITSLRINNNFISDITPLQNMVNLNWLSLSANQVVNISPLQNMSNLQMLFLVNNLIADLTPLQNITSLRNLYLAGNRFGNNISPIQGLSNLTILGLSSNNISTIQPIINSFPNLATFGILTGNSVPANEISAFRANHPNCSIQ